MQKGLAKNGMIVYHGITRIFEERGNVMKKRILTWSLLLCMLLTLLPVSALAAGTISVSYDQKNINDRTVTVTLPDLSGDSNAPDTVKITAAMYYEGNATETATFQKAISEVDPDTHSFEIELPYFGKWEITSEFLKNGAVAQRSMVYLPVVAEEFNIVCGGATTDVLIDSLVFFGNTSPDEFNAGIPTIVSLNRYKQYNWDKLPENMYRNPLLTQEENNSETDWVEFKMGRMKQYVKELLEINPNAKFHFYINDYGMYSFPKLVYENRVPEEQYTVTMVTDGSASYSTFKQAYDGIADASARHAQLVKEYEAFRQGVFDGTVTDYTSNSALPSGSLRIYNYAILDVEKNSRWWVVRKAADTFGIQDTDFQAKVLADPRITDHYINFLLANVQKAGNDDAFKSLYNFDDSGFQTARNNGKKLMMLIGTSQPLEVTYPVMDYTKFVTAYYGDEYAYFYKGHPGNYTADSPENVALYNAIGVEVLDPSIAAELFVFYNPDICMSGYASSLFQNVGEDSQDLALFRSTLEVAHADGNLKSYADKMDLFISDIGNNADTATFAVAAGDSSEMKAAKEKANESRQLVQALIPAAEKGDQNYMVQFNNSSTKTVSEYDFAIWNATKSVIHYIGIGDSGKYEILASDPETACDGGDSCPSKAFTDVDISQYYHESVDWAVTNQVTNGTSATTFSPGATCTRAQAVTFLWRAKGSPEPGSSSNPFTDVKSSAYYYKAVLWAVEQGITNGTSATTFSPEQGCTRGQVVTFLHRAAGKPAAGGTNPFSDVPAGQYYTDAVFWAVAGNVTNGTSATTFSPNETCTRAQIVTFLYRDLA